MVSNYQTTDAKKPKVATFEGRNSDETTVTLRKDEVIELLKTVEGIKRRLLSSLKTAP